MPSILDLIRAMSAGGGQKGLPMPAMPGIIPGYGGGTFNGDGSMATPVDGGVQMQPEPNSVTAPVIPDAGPSTAVPASAAPATSKKRGGILGALESVVAPEAGSFWQSALNNGIWNGKAGVAQYKQDQANNALAMDTKRAQNAKTVQDTRTAELRSRYAVAGNNVVDYGDGSAPPTIISAPTTPSENERLIDKWHSTPAGSERDLIERAIRGYQYTAPVLNAKADAAIRTGTAVAGARGAQARLTKRTQGAGTAKAAPKANAYALPSGWKMD